MKRVFTWLNNSLEEFLMGAGLIMMTAIMGIQVVFRYAFGMSLSWSEEITSRTPHSDRPCSERFAASQR